MKGTQSGMLSIESMQIATVASRALTPQRLANRPKAAHIGAVSTNSRSPRQAPG